MISFLREVFSRMIPKKLPQPGPMQQNIRLWSRMFADRPPWLDSNTQSLGLPAAIAGEFARLITVELDSRLSGGQRAAFLHEAYARVLDRLRPAVELACAGGGLIFKPYVDAGRIAVDLVPAWRFQVTAVDGRGEIAGAVFPDRLQLGGCYYTRLETHERCAGGYRIRNQAFRSRSPEQQGQPCSLREVPEWACLAPEALLPPELAGDGMLFSYFRIPLANQLDPSSPLGVSVFSRAVSLIEQADRQYSRILWEYEGSELAVDASEGALGALEKRLPVRRRRLFRELNLDAGGADLYQVFSPAIRDESLFNGLNQLLRRIEFNCSLAYGTLSDPQNVDRTAEEIREGRRRSYAAVCELQRSLQRALERLVQVMDCYATLYRLAPEGAYTLSFNWGDGVLQDFGDEYARRKELADAGYLRPEKLLAWYFGVDEQQARALLPDAKQQKGDLS